MPAEPTVDVLVLRALGLGDTLAAVPALRGLRRAVPGRIVLAGPGGPGGLLKAEGIIDDVSVAIGLSAQRLPRADIAVNLHGRGPQSHGLLQAAGPRRVVAFASTAAGVQGPRWREDEPERARWCRLVGEVWGVATDPDDVRLTPPRPTSVSAPSGVVIHPGAASAARRWPVERWSAVARRLAVDHHVAITGSPDEVMLARQVAAAAGLPSEQVLAGATSVADLAHVVTTARLVLCGDTGVAHLAYAYGTPSISLFGPTSPALWGPPSTGPHVALWHGNEPGDPHADRPDPALLDVSVAEVLDACDDLLTRASGVR